MIEQLNYEIKFFQFNWNLCLFFVNFKNRIAEVLKLKHIVYLQLDWEFVNVFRTLQVNLGKAKVATRDTNMNYDAV